MTNAKIFNQPVTDIIRKRTSIRTYKPSPLDTEAKTKIEGYFSELKGPFNSNVRFKLFDTKTVSENSNIKLGTYGVVRGASSFIASAVSEGNMNLENLGYELEKLILFATSLELGTCWMGGTFKKSEFAKAMELKPNEILPIISPIGYPSDSKSIFDNVLRTLAGSKNRKPWSEIFYDGSFQKALNENDAGNYKVPLEMVRLAPSASNKQPWRIVKELDSFHFYLSHAKGYSSALGFDMQRIDIGIAMCHFELTLKELGIEGTWKKSQPSLNTLNENMEYIISWYPGKA